MNPSQSWQLFALGSAFFAGLTALFGKIGVAGINSNLATLIRTFVILFLTVAIVSLRGEWQRPDSVSGRSLLFLILSGIATGFSWLCYYRALQLGPASRVAPVDKLSVAFAMLLAVVFLKESINWKVAAGGALIVAGSWIMLLA
jgi:bacterial/archaeal transporter family protein